MSVAAPITIVNGRHVGSRDGHVKVLLVDADPDDTTLFELACRKAGIPVQIDAVETATEAINRLAGAANRSSNETPGLVLVEPLLPGRQGSDVLRFVRSTPALDSVLVIVYTGSEDSRFREEAQDLGADGFLVKKQRFEDTVWLARDIYDRWRRSKPTSASLPHNSQRPDNKERQYRSS